MLSLNSNTLEAQGFLFSTSTQDNIFALEAQQKSSGKVFALQLDGDSIGQITNGLFKTVEEMAEKLKEAISGSSKSLEFTIYPEGKLTFSAFFNVEKKDSFTLNLSQKFPKEDIEQAKEVQEGAFLQGKNERRLDSLERNIIDLQQMKVDMDTFQALRAINEEQANQLTDLRDMIIRMDREFAQKMSGLERANAELKAATVFKPDISFTKPSFEVAHFTLSENNKRAELLSSNGTQGFEILPQIPSSEQYSYSAKINSTRNQLIYFGITTQAGNWKNNALNYQYWINDGKISGKVSRQPIGVGPFGGKDQIIRMEVDMNHGALTFFVDNKQVNSCSISKADTYFAFVGLRHAGDSVTLL